MNGSPWRVNLGWDSGPFQPQEGARDEIDMLKLHQDASAAIPSIPWEAVMKTTIRRTAGVAGAAVLTLASVNGLAAGCAHDVHGAPQVTVTKLSDNDSIIQYFSPATLIMDNPKDPRHRAFGECRGQGVVTKGVQMWTGGCVWKTADGDSWIGLWSSKPGDTGVEKREAMQGTASQYGTGKLASMGRINVKWTGLANGGSYFCED